MTCKLEPVIYCIFPRNHSAEGTLGAVTEDLARIRALGVDWIWLMPFYAVGVEGRKGKAGSPYCIRDYRNVEPSLGTLQDLDHLIEAAHQVELKVMIDVVFSHCARDSELVTSQPEWFFCDASGVPTRKIAEWTDIVDFDIEQRGLWNYHQDTMLFWVKRGVDGFRCDVAFSFPLEFWKRMRTVLEKEKEDLLWLAESCCPWFLERYRAKNALSYSPTELHPTFDLSYDYDFFWVLGEAFFGQRSAIVRWVDLLKWQSFYYPAGSLKMRILENHDQQRVASRTPCPELLEWWTAILYILRGATLVYAGQEFGESHLPNLFEHDPSPSLLKKAANQTTALHKELAAVKNKYLGGDMQIEQVDDFVVVRRNNGRVVAFFYFGETERRDALSSLGAASAKQILISRRCEISDLHCLFSPWSFIVMQESDCQPTAN